MSEDAFKQMVADKKLERQISECTNPDELRALLHASLESSGVASRNLETGMFERRDPLTPAQQQTEETEQVTRTEKIGGREITFTGTELEVEQQVVAAYKGADAAKAAAPTFREARAAHFKSKADREREIVDRAELEIQWKQGRLTNAEYIDKANLIGEYLEAKGFDVEAAAGAQYQKSWADATAEFLANSDWPGGDRNREQLGLRIIALGLTNAEDKVQALKDAYASMRESNALFDDVGPEQAAKLAENASPLEIIEAWKKTQADPSAANEEFIRLHSRSGASGVFDK